MVFGAFNEVHGRDGRRDRQDQGERGPDFDKVDKGVLALAIHHEVGLHGRRSKRKARSASEWADSKQARLPGSRPAWQTLSMRPS